MDSDNLYSKNNQGQSLLNASYFVKEISFLIFRLCEFSHSYLYTRYKREVNVGQVPSRHYFSSLLLAGGRRGGGRIGTIRSVSLLLLLLLLYLDRVPKSEITIAAKKAIISEI